MDNQILIYSIVTVIALVVVAYLVYIARAFGAQKALSEMSELSNFILELVDAAEKDGGSGSQKYKDVSDAVSFFISDKGIKLPPELIEQMIEGAVKLVHRAQDQRIQ